jgi:hypothetical protein
VCGDKKTIWGHGQVRNGGRISGRQLNPRRRRGAGIQPSLCSGSGEPSGVSFLYDSARRLERGRRQEATMILLRFYHITVRRKLTLLEQNSFIIVFSFMEVFYADSSWPLPGSMCEISVVLVCAF